MWSFSSGDRRQIYLHIVPVPLESKGNIANIVLQYWMELRQVS
jgi:hypothetical protein